MKVNIKKAAKLVGVSRSTLYNHIEQKGISVEPDLNGKPMIDTSELLRVYGDQVKIPDMSDELESDTKKHEKPRKLDNADSTELKYQVENLREKLNTLEIERERERKQATETIELLRTQVERADSERQKLTAVLTDQRSDREKVLEKEQRQSKQFEEMQKTIEDLKNRQDSILAEKDRKKGFFGKIFGT